jgi:hypothetical protein
MNALIDLNCVILKTIESHYLEFEWVWAKTENLHRNFIIKLFRYQKVNWRELFSGEFAFGWRYRIWYQQGIMRIVVQCKIDAYWLTENLLLRQLVSLWRHNNLLQCHSLIKWDFPKQERMSAEILSGATNPCVKCQGWKLITFVPSPSANEKRI